VFVFEFLVTRKECLWLIDWLWHYSVCLFVCLFLARQSPVGQGLLIHEVSRSHKRHITVGRTALDEWSTRLTSVHMAKWCSKYMYIAAGRTVRSLYCLWQNCFGTSFRDFRWPGTDLNISASCKAYQWSRWLEHIIVGGAKCPERIRRCVSFIFPSSPEFHDNLVYRTLQHTIH